MRIILRELTFLRPHWRRLLWTYTCVVGAAATSMASPWILKEAIDVGLGGDHPGFLLAAGVLVILTSLLRGAFSYGQTYLGEYLSQAVAYDIRNALYDRLQSLGYSYHDRQQTGQLMARATADVESVRIFIQFGVLRMSFIVLLVLVSCYLLLTINWQLTLLVFALLPAIGYRAISSSFTLRPQWLRVQEITAQMTTTLQESLSGIKVVKAFAQEEAENARFGRGAQELYDTSYATTETQAANSAIMSIIQFTIVAFILWYGGREVILGQMSLGGLVAFNSYLVMLAMPVRVLGWLSDTIARAVSSGERIFEVLDAQTEVAERPNAVKLSEVEGRVAFEDVSFKYSSLSPTLRNVSFQVKPGQVVALLGSTGSGKSTIVNLIPRFYDVTQGRITVDGIDIRDVTLASLRRQVGIVHQETFLFTASIRDNIAYGHPGANLEEVMATAKSANLHDFIISLPAGYDTWVSERGVALSGGQKQRLAIARTLLMNPKILILDDSTSNVDVQTEQLIQEALRELMRGCTTFVITQRLATVKGADLILVLQEGRIVEAGSHQELLARDGPYREIYELQLKDQEEALQGLALGARRD